jgi:hypothetical protein
MSVVGVPPYRVPASPAVRFLRALVARDAARHPPCARITIDHMRCDPRCTGVEGGAAPVPARKRQQRGEGSACALVLTPVPPCRRPSASCVALALMLTGVGGAPGVWPYPWAPRFEARPTGHGCTRSGCAAFRAEAHGVRLRAF